MSSTSRSPDGKPETPEEPDKKAGSPGRYSLADDGDDVPSTRIDSTTRMPAVRPEVQRPSQNLPPPSSRGGARPPPPPPPPPPSSKNLGPNKRPPIGLPSRPQPPPSPKTQQAMPAPLAKGAAPVKAPETKSEVKPDSVEGTKLPRPPKLPSGDKAKAAKTEASDAAKTQKNAKVEIPSVEDVGPETEKEDRTDPQAKMPSIVPASLAPLTEPSSSRPSRPPSILPPRRVSSLRPPPAPRLGSIPPAPPPPLVLEGFDEGSIAFAFDALVSEGPSGEPGKHEFDLAPVRELFAELAANHMRHVRDFMIDVKWGEVTRDWIHICVPPVRTLRRAAERLELVELGVALEKLGADLDLANSAGGQMLDAAEKQRLLDTYNELVTILPQAFALDRDKTQREAVIVQALLLQVPDVRKVTIDKLHAAGLTGLNVLFDANANDIAHVAGIPDALAVRIVERVAAYRDELKSASPQDARAAEREKLASLNLALKKHHDAYETASSGWGPDAKTQKRENFRAREETWLAISVLLARFGEVDRLQGIEKVPFATRITQLTDYLEEAREKYRSAEG